MSRFQVVATTALMRLAFGLPQGSKRRVLLAYLKEAGAAEDLIARSSLLSGMSGIPVSKVERMMKSGEESRTPLTKLLVEKGWDPQEADQFATPGWDSGLFTAVVRGSNASLGKAVSEASKYQPGLKGTSGEDMAHVLSVGGLKWPGDRFDNGAKSFPDAPRGDPRSKLKGRYVPRDEPVFLPGENLFMSVGEKAKGMSSVNFAWLSKRLFGEARTMVRDWVRSVDAGRYTPYVTDVEGTPFLPVPGYEGSGGPTDDFLAKEFYLDAIDRRMESMLSSIPAQRWLWGALMRALNQGKNFLRFTKGTPPVSLQATKFMDWVESEDAENIDEEATPNRRGVVRLFNKIYPKMKKALNSLSDAEYERGLPSKMRQLMKNQDIREVYLSDLRGKRKRASASRVADLWLIRNVDLGLRKKAALDPVSLGEMMISAASQARLFHKLDMKRFVGVYEEVGMNLVRLGDTDDFDDRQYLISEIDSGLKFLRGHDIKAMSAALEGMTAAYGLVAGRFR